MGLYNQAFSLALALFLGSSTAWMLGRTPPWAIVTPARSLFSSSSFLNILCQTLRQEKKSPDGKLQMPWDDARLLVVPGSVASQLQDLCSQVLHDCCHVHWSTSSNPLSVVALPTHIRLTIELMRKRPNLSSLWILPTGN